MLGRRREGELEGSKTVVTSDRCYIMPHFDLFHCDKHVASSFFKASSVRAMRSKYRRYISACLAHSDHSSSIQMECRLYFVHRVAWTANRKTHAQNNN